MKKFLCFALVLCLALAPVGVFADEYDNGENGYEYAVENYENGDEPTEYYNGDEPTEYYNGDEPTGYENGDEPTDYESAEEVSADLSQAWVFGAGEESTDGWVGMQGDVDPATGYVVPVYGEDAMFRWHAPFAGTFTVTGSVIVENAMFAIVGGGFEAGDLEGYDFDFEVELNTFGPILFSARIIDADEDASAKWNITITYVPAVEDVVAVDEVDETEEVTEEVEDIVPVDEPVVDPLADVPVRYVDGVEFVAFRLFANAFGYYSLAWDGATSTVTVVDVVSFTLVEAGGFNDNGVVYVPMAFALSLF